MSKKKMIPISKTIISSKSANEVSKVIKSGWLVQGKKVKEFEESWSRFTKLKFSSATTSCTSGMILALKALNISHGDEVIVPSFSWISTANVVELVGAKPIFCDISLDDFNIDTGKIEKLINKKTKAIIPVHLFGFPAKMDVIMKIAKKFKLFVIEDAACGFGSYINDKHVGNFGDFGVFSFHPRKAITTGEGGMVNCRVAKNNRKLNILKDHGAFVTDFQRHNSKQPYFLADHVEAGFNQRLTDIQAALGVEQMKIANKIFASRRKLAKKYFKRLKHIKQLRLPPDNRKYQNGFQSFPCLLNIFQKKNLQEIRKVNKIRNKLMIFLYDKKISTRPATHAIHMLSFYKKKYNFKSDHFINSKIANDCTISLPIYYGMTINELEYVCKQIDIFFKKF